MAALLGIKTRNDSPRDVADFERKLGRPIDFVMVFLPANDWGALGNPTFYINRAAPAGRALELSVPVFPEGGDENRYYQEAFGGPGRAAWRGIANAMKGFRPNDPEVWFRFGWEGNMLYQWNYADNPQREDWYKRAFQAFVEEVRGIMGARAKFTFCPGAFMNGYDWMRAYPGDDVVDAIGIDSYWNAQWTDQNSARAWDLIANTPFCMAYQVQQAKAHGKRLQLNEWGVNRADGDGFVRKAKSWMNTHGYHAQCYWHEPTAYDGYLLNGSNTDWRWPAVGAAFAESFGPGAVWDNGDPPPPPPPPGEGVKLDGGNSPNPLIGTPAADEIKLGTGGAFVDGKGGADLFIVTRGVGKVTLAGFNASCKLQVKGYAKAELRFETAHTFGGATGPRIVFPDGGHVWMPRGTLASLDAVEFDGVIEPPPPPPPPPPVDEAAIRAAIKAADEAVAALNGARKALEAVLPD